MRITTIRYERLHNLGNYEHEKLCAEAQVEDAEDPVAEATMLRAFVQGQIARADNERASALEPFRSCEPGTRLRKAQLTIVVDSKENLAIRYHHLDNPDVSGALTARELWEDHWWRLSDTAESGDDDYDPMAEE